MPVSLTVYNIDTWCSVSVGSNAASIAAKQTVCVADGAVTLVAKAKNTTYILGDWHGTTGDTGSGDPGTVTDAGGAAESQASVSVSGATACVWVCCPFAGGSGCTVADPCP
jgi:hypothetical protein